MARHSAAGQGRGGGRADAPLTPREDAGGEADAEEEPEEMRRDGYCPEARAESQPGLVGVSMVC